MLKRGNILCLFHINNHLFYLYSLGRYIRFYFIPYQYIIGHILIEFLTTNYYLVFKNKNIPLKLEAKLKTDLI